MDIVDIVEKKTGTGNDLKSMTVDELKRLGNECGSACVQGKTDLPVVSC